MSNAIVPETNIDWLFKAAHLKMVSNPPAVCFYHNKCMDGLASAWLVNRLFNYLLKSKVVESAPAFIPASYSDVDFGIDLIGKGVLLVDFSFKRKQLIEIAQVASYVIILDHHESAARELVDLPDNVLTSFSGKWDMTEFCGASLVYGMLLANYTVPALHDMLGNFFLVKSVIEFIQVRDLWDTENEEAWESAQNLHYYLLSHINYPKDKVVNTSIGLQTHITVKYAFAALENALGVGVVISEGKFDRNDPFAHREVRQYWKFTQEGSRVYAYHNKLVRSAVATAIMGTIAGHKVPIIVNCLPELISDALNILAQDHIFAASIFTYNKGNADTVIGVCSMRSDKTKEDGGYNVALIAESFGGGGHRNAAGFSYVTGPREDIIIGN